MDIFTVAISLAALIGFAVLTIMFLQGCGDDEDGI